MRASTALFIVGAVLVFVTACAVHNTDTPPLMGPSVRGLNLTITTTPDNLQQDGGSQSSIVVRALDPNGRPIPGLAVHLQILVAGQLFDFGTLSARTVVTGSDGTARAVYTAPPPFGPPFVGVDVGTTVTIVATASGTNFQTSNPLPAPTSETAAIRLYPIGVISIAPDTPTPQFTISPTPVNIGVLTRFDASASCGGQLAGGRCQSSSAITNYSWNFGDGATGIGVTATHTYTVAASFNVMLTVTNDRGISASTTVPVAVGTTPGPTAAFVFSPAAPCAAQTVVFNADGSHTAPGHTITQYSWIFGDNDATQPSSGFVVAHTFALPGSYNVTLTVLDDTGQKNTTQQTVSVKDATPTASFTFSPASPAAPATVTFNAGTSTGCADALPLSFSWDFGTGPISSGNSPTITHAYPVAGTFNVTLTVTDKKGRTATSNQSVIVN